MKYLLSLSTLLFFFSASIAQTFSLSTDPIFRDAGGRVLPLALTGGLNQPQFSNIDLDKDGKLDLLVYDRDGNRVLTFIATHANGVISYRYDPSYEEFFPNALGYLLLRDFNDDGYNDIVYQTRDSARLWLNNNGALPSFTDAGGLYGTDQVQPVVFNPYRRFSQPAGCLPAYVDIDLDDDMDFVTNLDASGSELLLQENQSTEKSKSFEDWEFDLVDKCYGGIAEDGNGLLINNPCLYRQVYKKKHTATKTLCFVDNDADGDLDLFYGNSEELTNPVYFFENGKSDLGSLKDTFISIDTAYFSVEVERKMPIAPGMFKVDIDLDGVPDLVVSGNESVKASFPIHQRDHVLMFLNRDAANNPDYEYQGSSFLVGDMVDLGGNVAPVFGDLDGDGDQDLIVATSGDHYYTGDTTDVLVYYENIGSKTNPDFKEISNDYLGLSALNLQAIVPALADIDGDGDLDLFLGKADGTISRYTNSGTTTNPVFGLKDDAYAGIDVGFLAAPEFVDLDEDGLLDLVVGSNKGTIEYYRNTGTAASAAFSLENDSLGGILINELIPTTIFRNFEPIDTFELDREGNSTPRALEFKNGKRYLAVGGLEGKVRLYEIESDLTEDFKEKENYMPKPFSTDMYNKDWGYRTYPAVADLDNDRTPDLLIGNSRGGFQYLKGSEDDNVSVSSVTRESFKLIPNPANSHIRLYVLAADKLEYSITDIQGKEIQSGESLNGQLIALSEEFSTGVYFVNLKADNVYYQTQKMVISK